jgi:hypothetical protein
LDEELRFTSFGIVHLDGIILLSAILIMAAKILPKQPSCYFTNTEWDKNVQILFKLHQLIQGVSGGIVNILGGDSIDYSE